MSIELAIVLGCIIGLIIGLMIDSNARRERDHRITELEGELTVRRNVVKSLNEDNVRLRKRLSKNEQKTD